MEGLIGKVSKALMKWKDMNLPPIYTGSFWRVLLWILDDQKGTKAVTGAVPFQKVHFCT